MAGPTAHPWQDDSEHLRVALFTDTLGDVNGVSRFIRTIGDEALATGRSLNIITSTRFDCPDRPNVHNLKPLYSRAMPGYPTLDIVLPPTGALRACADDLRPHVVHVSTPGPVGSAGRRYARSRGVPLVGTYHTDFPAYIDHLFNDDALTWICTRTMSRFYKPFACVLTRSDEYRHAIERLGVSSDRIERLIPGIDTNAFHPNFRDQRGDIWNHVPGARRDSVKVLFVGRVSVEKNLPLLTRVWSRAYPQLTRTGVDAQLIVVGDGPFRPQMAEALDGLSAVFAGFRHALELSTIYASCDLFVFPSLTDTLGQVVMESQAAGLPVIVSDQGGPSGVVDNGLTGFVLPAARPSDETKWVEAICRLASDRALRTRMGHAGAAKIAPLSIRHSFEQFWNVHKRIAALARTPEPGG